MKMMLRRWWYLLGLLLVASLGCTDAQWERYAALGDEHSIQLYSGGELVREWRSTGKVLSEESSDGYYFKDKESGVLVRVTGDLVITPVGK